MKKRRTIKKFEDLGNINFRDMRNKAGNLKPLDRKFAISFARQIATGFESDKVRLDRKISDKAYKEARLFIDAYIEESREGKAKLIKPHSSQRKLYAESIDINPRMKIYFMPVLKDDDTFERVKIGGEVFLKRISKNSDMIFFKFNSQKDLIKNTKKETEKLFAKINKKLGKDTYAVKIRCGKHEFERQFFNGETHVQIKEWMHAYGKEKVKAFCLGFNAYTFKNQNQIPENSLKLKGEKKKRRTKREKIRVK